METTMQTLEKATRLIADRLGLINERAANITSVVSTIAKVAAQTNLLSLNAAIEAEPASTAWDLPWWHAKSDVWQTRPLRPPWISSIS